MDTITIKAYAKVNLGLDVVRRREDGYHLVSMIMQAIDLHDTLTISKAEQGFSLSCDREDLSVGEDNLIIRAAKLLQSEVPFPGANISLQKRIPVAAGLAGGSSDAAAVLKGLNELYNLGLSLTELQAIGIKLGADIPYCLLGGTALAEGIGEILTPLPDLTPVSMIIAKPDIEVSTKWVYQSLTPEILIPHPDIPGMRRAVEQDDIEGIMARMDNVLARVTEKEYPVIVTIREKLEEAGAAKAMMSGSGPTVFGIFREDGKAREALEILRDTGLCRDLVKTTFHGRTEA